MASVTLTSADRQTRAIMRQPIAESHFAFDTSREALRKRFIGKWYDEQTAFENKVTIYVPSTTNVDSRLDASTAGLFVDTALTVLSSLFGGATSTQAIGAWSASSGKLVKESVTLVYAYAPVLTAQALIDVKNLALLIKRELTQEAIGVEINGKFFLL